MPPRPISNGIRRVRSLKERIRLTIHARGSPEAIARGIALGLFVAFTPLFGLHLPIAWFGAMALRANRTATILSLFVSNAATFVPIFAFTYAVGIHILPGRFAPDARLLLHDLSGRMRTRPLYAVWTNFQDLILSLKDLFWPMMVGGLVVGAIAAGLAYPLVLRLVVRVRENRRRWLAKHPNALNRNRARSMPEDEPGDRAHPPDTPG